MSDSEVASSIGKFIKSERLRQRKTQEELATESGIKRRTLTRIENGRPFDLLTLIALIRHLDLLEGFIDFFEEYNPISPSLIMKMERSKPKRVRHRRVKSITGDLEKIKQSK